MGNNEMMPVDELLPLLDGDGGTPPYLWGVSPIVKSIMLGNKVL